MKRETILTHKNIETIKARGGLRNCAFSKCGIELKEGDVIITSKMCRATVRRYHKACWEYMQI